MKKLNTCVSILLLILALLYTVFGMSQTNNKSDFLPAVNKTGTIRTLKYGYILQDEVYFTLQAVKCN